VDEITYKKECLKHTCEVIDNIYYDKDGNIVDQASFEENCKVVGNPQTDMSLNHKDFLILFILGIVCFVITYKKNKFWNVK